MGQSLSKAITGQVIENKKLCLAELESSINCERDFLKLIQQTLFIEKFLCRQLWPGAVVVMDNYPPIN